MPSRLFVTGGLELSFAEGTTQGDPMAMPVYAVGIVPLLSSINPNPGPTPRHVASADDLGGAGQFQQLRHLWDKVVKIGPKLGYYPKASKSWLVVKSEELAEEAKRIFSNTHINITVK